MKDKILHFAVCLAIALIFGGDLNAAGMGAAAAGVVSFYLAMLAGIGKEAWDVWDDMAWYSLSGKDLLADLAGAIVGSGIYFILVRRLFDFDEFLRYMFGCAAILIPIAVIAFSCVGVLIERKALLYPKYRKNWWKWWKHKEE